MAVVIGTESPRLGYEYERTGYLAESEWARMMGELLKLCSCWGYGSPRFGRLPPRGGYLGFDLRKYHLKSRLLLGGIAIGLVFQQNILFRRTFPVIAPERIVLKPWSSFEPLSKAMAVIEKISQEDILADKFRMVYCCLSGVKGFNISIEHPDY